jgi:hypothetical protein
MVIRLTHDERPCRRANPTEVRSTGEVPGTATVRSVGVVMRGFRLHILFAALALAPLIAACGGSSSSTQTNPFQAFKSGYEQLRGPVNQTGNAVGAELQHASGQTDAQVQTAFQQLASRFQSQVSQLETLKPPHSLAADWNSVLGPATRIESDLTAVVAAAATHNPSAGEQAGASLMADVQDLRPAAATIKAKLGIK